MLIARDGREVWGADFRYISPFVRKSSNLIFDQKKKYFLFFIF